VRKTRVLRRNLAAQPADHLPSDMILLNKALGPNRT